MVWWPPRSAQARQHSCLSLLLELALRGAERGAAASGLGGLSARAGGPRAGGSGAQARREEAVDASPSTPTSNAACAPDTPAPVGCGGTGRAAASSRLAEGRTSTAALLLDRAPWRPQRGPPACAVRPLNARRPSRPATTRTCCTRGARPAMGDAADGPLPAALHQETGALPSWRGRQEPRRLWMRLTAAGARPRRAASSARYACSASVSTRSASSDAA